VRIGDDKCLLARARHGLPALPLALLSSEM
jgi:hypothetical protein